MLQALSPIGLLSLRAQISTGPPGNSKHLNSMRIVPKRQYLNRENHFRNEGSGSWNLPEFSLSCWTSTEALPLPEALSARS